ncbi:LAGLIDADG family homing endonuclease [Patescibacteria group bacterium AH-259-L07]|nr:LAGLIDADG family homing endonuclease [Patescibacteria group bacterium AH-259-L07]
MKISNEEKSYLAGYIDADGSLGIYKSNHGYYSVIVTASSTDLRVLNRLKFLYKGSVRCVRHGKENWKDEYRWVIATKQSVKFLNDIYSYLILKKDRAKVLLDFQSTMKSGQYLTPEIIKIREKLLRKIATLNKKGVSPTKKLI